MYTIRRYDIEQADYCFCFKVPAGPSRSGLARGLPTCRFGEIVLVGFVNAFPVWAMLLSFVLRRSSSTLDILLLLFVIVFYYTEGALH